MARDYSTDDSENVIQTIAQMDLSMRSILIGIIKSIRTSEHIYILEMENGTYYKFNTPRELLSRWKGLNLSEVIQSIVDKKENIFLMHGKVFYYICWKGCPTGKSKKIKNDVIADGGSIEEIKPHDVFEELLDLP